MLPGQLDLLDYIAARATDPQTSKDAAKRVRGNVTMLEAGVIGALESHPEGLTSHEIAERLNLSLVTVSPRIAPLQRKGKVEDSGIRREGRSVWRIIK